MKADSQPAMVRAGRTAHPANSGSAVRRERPLFTADAVPIAGSLVPHRVVVARRQLQTDPPSSARPARYRASHKTLGNGHAPNARHTQRIEHIRGVRIAVHKRLGQHVVIQPQPTFALRDHAYMPLPRPLRPQRRIGTHCIRRRPPAGPRWRTHAGRCLGRGSGHQRLPRTRGPGGQLAQILVLELEREDDNLPWVQRRVRAVAQEPRLERCLELHLLANVAQHVIRHSSDKLTPMASRCHRSTGRPTV